MITETANIQVTDAHGQTVSKAFDFTYSEYPLSRFWRMYATSTDLGDGYMNLNQIALRTQPGGVNQCIGSGGTADQSSEYNSSLGAIHAFLETLDTDGEYWHSANQSTGWWASFDFGAGILVPVAEVSITNCNIAGRAPRDFSIQTSQDGQTWTNVASFSGVQNWELSVPKVFSIPPLA